MLVAYIHTYGFLPPQIYTCIYTYMIHAHICTSIDSCMSTYLPTFIHTYVHTYIFMSVCLLRYGCQYIYYYFQFCIAFNSTTECNQRCLTWQIVTS